MSSASPASASSRRQRSASGERGRGRERVGEPRGGRHRLALPALRVLMIGMPLQALVAIHLGVTGDSSSYVAAAIGYNIFWAGLLPFYIAVAVQSTPAASSLRCLPVRGSSVSPWGRR